MRLTRLTGLLLPFGGPHAGSSAGTAHFRLYRPPWAQRPPFATAGLGSIDPTVPTHIWGFVEAIGAEPDYREAAVEAL